MFTKSEEIGGFLDIERGLKWRTVHTYFRLPAFELFTNFQSQFPKRRLPSHTYMVFLSLETESKMAQLPKNYIVI